jgi:hypothetical protein
VKVDLTDEERELLLGVLAKLQIQGIQGAIVVGEIARKLKWTPDKKQPARVIPISPPAPPTNPNGEKKTP